jgi:hypothetical protein
MAATGCAACRIATTIGGERDGSRNHGKGKRPAKQSCHNNSPFKNLNFVF